MGFPKEGQPSEEREGGSVTAADAPLHRIEVVDAIAHALALPKREPSMTECDHPAWSFHTNGLTAKVLQCLVVGKGHLGKRRTSDFTRVSCSWASCSEVAICDGRASAKTSARDSLKLSG